MSRRPYALCTAWLWCCQLVLTTCGALSRHNRMTRFAGRRLVLFNVVCLPCRGGIFSAPV